MLSLRAVVLAVSVLLAVVMPGRPEAVDPAPVLLTEPASVQERAVSGPWAPKQRDRAGNALGWSNCLGPIRIYVDKRGLPDGFMPLLRRVVAEARSASGLAFVWTVRKGVDPPRGGTSSGQEYPRLDEFVEGIGDSPFIPTRPQIYIYSPRKETSEFPFYGEPWMVNDAFYDPVTQRPERPAIRLGLLKVFRGSAHRAIGTYAGGRSLPKAYSHLLHEWGHVMGLTDVRGTRQVMGRSSGVRHMSYRAGDEAGLRAMGNRCWQNPPADRRTPPTWLRLERFPIPDPLMVPAMPVGQSLRIESSATSMPKGVRFTIHGLGTCGNIRVWVNRPAPSLLGDPGWLLHPHVCLDEDSAEVDVLPARTWGNNLDVKIDPYYKDSLSSNGLAVGVSALP